MLMKLIGYLRVCVLLVVFLTGCSSLPGLRVLSGQDTAEAEQQRIAGTIDLVMADKTRSVNSSMIAAANRVEAAAGNVDIIQIRQDLLEDVFYVYMILRTEGDPSSNVLREQLAFYDSLRRAIELTWQGTLKESERSDILRIEIIQPAIVSSLNEGPVYLGIKQLVVQIAREDAVAYLSRPHNLDDFVALITSGTMSWGPPDSTASSIYGVQPAVEAPNHPTFMFPTLLQ